MLIYRTRLLWSALGRVCEMLIQPSLHPPNTTHTHTPLQLWINHVIKLHALFFFCSHLLPMHFINTSVAYIVVLWDATIYDRALWRCNDSNSTKHGWWEAAGLLHLSMWNALFASTLHLQCSHQVTPRLEMSNIFLLGPSDSDSHCTVSLVFWLSNLHFSFFLISPVNFSQATSFIFFHDKAAQGLIALSLKSAALHHSVLLLYWSPVIDDGFVCVVCVFILSVSWKAGAMELRVGNKYRLGRKIGSGSFGDIYLGEIFLF